MWHESAGSRSGCAAPPRSHEPNVHPPHLPECPRSRSCAQTACERLLTLLVHHAAFSRLSQSSFGEPVTCGAAAALPRAWAWAAAWAYLAPRESYRTRRSISAWPQALSTHTKGPDSGACEPSFGEPGRGTEEAQHSSRPGRGGTAQQPGRGGTAQQPGRWGRITAAGMLGAHHASPRFERWCAHPSDGHTCQDAAGARACDTL